MDPDFLVAADHPAVDLAYAAGFVDGEGAISILRVRSRHPGGRDIYKVLVVVVNNNRGALERLQAQFGGRVYSSGFKTKPAHWRPSFQWHLWGMECEGFLRSVRPYLRIKAPLADSALDFYALQHLRGRRAKTDPEVWERLKELSTVHRALVQKGSAPRRTHAAAIAEAGAASKIDA